MMDAIVATMLASAVAKDLVVYFLIFAEELLCKSYQTMCTGERAANIEWHK